MRTATDDGGVGYGYTWIEREVYVFARVLDGIVTAYAATVRSRWFWPRLGTSYNQPGPIRLGRTRFGDLAYEPQERVAMHGARRFGYGEVHSFGNPGGYRAFVVAYNDAGCKPGYDLTRLGSALHNRDPKQRARAQARFPATRDRARINTYGVTAPYPVGDVRGLRRQMDVFGADLDEVRIVDDHVPLHRRLLRPLRMLVGRIKSRRARKLYLKDLDAEP